jgi:hypothetical protein
VAGDEDVAALLAGLFGLAVLVVLDLRGHGVCPPPGCFFQSLVGKGVRWGLRLHLTPFGVKCEGPAWEPGLPFLDLYFYFIGVRVACTPSIFRVQEAWFVGVAGDDECFGG